ncbi:MAG: universal stress protein [Bacteroidetes bacterium]|nr:universal stress protein [Bacteroidota bacterium]MBS1757201.1 universal stress protein [Bacteroidota bacterium]
MKKVIIAIDYNPDSEKVAKTGFTIAKALQASVLLVHVIAEASYYAMSYSPIMGFEGFISENSLLLGEEIKKEANNFLKSTAKFLGDETIQTAVLEGKTTEAILEYAKKENADLMVIGSHSHSGLYKLFISATATSFLKHCTIPLLIIPTNEA